MSTHKTQIDWIPPGKPTWHDGWITGYARGLDLILNKLGHSTDYVTLMGDFGQAFIMQGEELSRRDNGGIDVG